MAAKYNWNDKQIAFIQVHFQSMTARQMADALVVKIHHVRMMCYKLGLKKMEMEYWDDDQLAFLLNNYKEMGDMEMAELFNAICPKQKPWTLKHIEKKRKYLELKRTPNQLKAIKQRNIENGCFADCAKKRWETMGVAPEGEIRIWQRKGRKKVPYIKIDGHFIHWAPWVWAQQYGPVPKGYNVVYKLYREDVETLTDLHNLEVISDAELAKRSAAANSQSLSDNYIVGILTHGKPFLRTMVKDDKSFIEIKRQQLLLNRTIKQHQQHGN